MDIEGDCQSLAVVEKARRASLGGMMLVLAVDLAATQSQHPWTILARVTP